MSRQLTHQQKIAREERRMAAHLRELAATDLRGIPPAYPPQPCRRCATARRCY